MCRPLGVALISGRRGQELGASGCFRSGLKTRSKSTEENIPGTNSHLLMEVMSDD